MAAMERRLSRYLHLICEHYTTIESQLFYSGPPHPPKTYYCHVCDKWLPEKPKIVYVVPDEPPF